MFTAGNMLRLRLLVKWVNVKLKSFSIYRATIPEQSCTEGVLTQRAGKVYPNIQSNRYSRSERAKYMVPLRKATFRCEAFAD